MKKKKHKIVDSPIFVSNKKCGITNWVPFTNQNYENIESNSWFDIKHCSNPDSKKINQYSTTSPIIPPESFKQQQASINKLKKKNPKLNKKPVFINAKKIRLYPTLEQQKILDIWFNLFADMYNVSIDYIRKNIIVGKEFDPKIIKKSLNFMQIRKKLYNKKHKIQSSINENQIPIHILDEAIKLAVSNYKTCMTNLIKENIKRFCIKEWAYNRKQKIIKIEKSFFTKGTFCSKIFPLMEASEPLNNVNGTSTLQFDQNTGKYILFVPRSIKFYTETKNDQECGGDIGERTFLETYSENEVYSFGNDIRDNPDIKNSVKKINKIKELLKLKKGERNVTFYSLKKINGEYMFVKIKKKINRSSLKRGMRKYQRRIENKIKDMHYKIAYFLVHKYDNIYLGKFNIRSILSRKNKTISKQIKDTLRILSPGKFWKILEYMGYKYSTKTKRVS